MSSTPIRSEGESARGARQLFTAVLVSFLLLVAGPAWAQANNQEGGGRAPEAPDAGGLSWEVLSLDAIGCGAGETDFTTLLSGYAGGPERFRTIVDAGGLRYMDEDAGTPCCGNGTYGWSLYNSSSGGPTTAVFPLPPGTPVTVDFGLIQGVGGPYVYLRRVVLSQCDGGTIVSDDVLLGGNTLLAIPTLSKVGLALLALLMAAGAAWALRRRRTA